MHTILYLSQDSQVRVRVRKQHPKFRCFEMLRLVTLILLMPLATFSANPPGASWSKDEVSRTKERLWTLMNNPGKFVSKKQNPKEHGPCGKDCWLECDDFKTSGPHDFCPHCDDLDCTTCQCCRGWCDMPSRSLEPSPAKFIRLAFHDCLKYVEDIHTLKCLVNLQGIINLQALNNKVFL